jgi:hypothetical protein
MNYKELIDELLNELSYRVGIVDLKNKNQQSIISEILSEWGEIEAKQIIMEFLTEAPADTEGEDKDYIHIGRGVYVRKNDVDAQGKAKEGSQKYDKDDTGSMKPISQDEYEKLKSDQGEEGEKAASTTTQNQQGGVQGGDETQPETGTSLKDPSYQAKVEKEDETRKKLNGDESQSESNIPDYQIKHYKEVAQTESVKIENDTPRSERVKSLQNVYAKLQLISMGEDVELDDNDISNLSKMVISGNPRSGQLYDSSMGTSKADGIQSVSEKSPNYANRNIDKNELINNWNKVVQYMDSKNIPRESRPKFKAGVNTLIDNPPKVGHSPVSMKPNRLMESVPKTPANQLMESKTIADLKTKQGIEVGDDDLFGVPLDRNNPKSFLDNIGLVVSSTQQYIDGVNSPDTKAYFDKFNDGINSITNDSNLSDDQKLQKINEELPQLFTQLYNDALEVSDDEAKNVLKDFGELVVYMDFLSKKEEVYLPVSGNYPLGDVIVVKRNGDGEALTIDSVSIKSQRGSEDQPGSSAMEFCKHFANVYPEHKSTFESLGALHTNSVDSVKLDDVKDQNMKSEIESIQKLDDMKSWDDAKKVCDDLGLDWGKVETSLERTHYPKYKNEIEFTPEGMKNVVKELVYRQYSFKKTLDTMSDLNLDTKLKFVEVVVEPEKVAVRPKGENSTTADFAAHDKGYLGKGKVIKDPPPPKVGPVKYESANMALKYKPKKSE